MECLMIPWIFELSFGYIALVLGFALGIECKNLEQFRLKGTSGDDPVDFHLKMGLTSKSGETQQSLIQSSFKYQQG